MMPEQTPPVGHKVVVLTNGFVFVGQLHEKDSNDNYLISNCRNIRVWGTEGKGLGYLQHGPTRDTLLDDVGLLVFPRHALVYWFDTEVEPWDKHKNKG